MDAQMEKQAYAQQRGYIAGGTQNCAPSKEPDPNSVGYRLAQLIYGLNACNHATRQIGTKLWGAGPEDVGNMNQSLDPPITSQLDMLTAKVQDLQQSLESILKAF